MRRGWILGSILTLIAIGVFGFLFWKIQDVGHDEYTENVSNLRHLQRVDAAWTVSVLKSQLLLSENYDELASFLPEIRTLRAKLQNSELEDELKTTLIIKGELDRYLALQAEKEDLIERFKSKHAVLRNSTRYLPQAGDMVVEIASSRKMNQLANSVLENLKDIYGYMITPTNAQRVSLSKTLQMDVMQYPTDIANPTSNFLSHANLILEEKEPANEILEQITAIPTAKQAGVLLDLYAQFHDRRLAEGQKYQSFLLAYTGIILILGILFAVRSIRSYGSARENLALTEANQLLEENVSERTRELETAYRKLKGSQAQLVHAGRMASIGQLVAGVAHEVNTPLGYLRGNVETLTGFFDEYDELSQETNKISSLLEAENPDDDQIANQLAKINGLANQLHQENTAADSKQLLEDMQYGIEQIGLIVKSLKDFSRIDRAREEQVDLNEVVENTLRISHNLVKKHAEIIKELQPLPTITCAPSQINQVLLNLITNAAHAIEQKEVRGKIRISTHIADGRWACINIADNGIGMDASVSENIFEPFFTTKEAGKGTGLGLSICHNIIQEHRGHLRFKSAPGKGTAFQIALPIAPAPRRKAGEIQDGKE